MTNMTPFYSQAREEKKSRKFKNQVVLILFVLALLLFIEAIVVFKCKLDLNYWLALPITAIIVLLFGFWFIKNGPIGEIEPTDKEIQKAANRRKFPSVNA